jgi:hypothetical protein
MMVSERQKAANRRNARKSTGPRSHAGKKRASRNSYRHGLSFGVAAAAEFAKHVDALAQRIAGAGADTVTFELARSAARAEFDLAQVRRIKVMLIARMSEFGEIEVPDPLRTVRDIRRILKLDDAGLPWDFSVPPAPEMPTSEPERSAEAVRRALPELVKLDRYERRAATRRDRATRQIIVRKMLMHNQ